MNSYGAGFVFAIVSFTPHEILLHYSSGQERQETLTSFWRLYRFA